MPFGRLGGGAGTSGAPRPADGNGVSPTSPDDPATGGGGSGGAACAGAGVSGAVLRVSAAVVGRFPNTACSRVSPCA
jgi:hypothetical protein